MFLLAILGLSDGRTLYSLSSTFSMTPFSLKDTGGSSIVTVCIALYGNKGDKYAGVGH